MKLIRKINKQLAALVLALVLTATPQLSMAAQLQNTTASKQEIRLQDDFYEAVNKDWLKSTKLKPGYTSLDTMDEMSDRCDEQIQALFADILKNESKYDKNSTEKKMINLYHNYLNKAERNKQDIEPIKPYLESIKQIKTTDDLNKLLTSDLLIDNLSGICNLNVTADFKDSNKKSLYLFSTSLLLGDSDYYNKPSDMAKALEAATTTYLNKILVLAGYSKEDASKKVAQAYEFEKLLAPSIMGSDEVTQLTNRYETLYNPYTLDDLDKLAPNLKLKSYIQARTKNKVNKVIVAEPKWLKALDKV